MKNSAYKSHDELPLLLLPHEVFELGLEQGLLLVYIYLVHQKNLKHSPAKLRCAIVSKAVGLCEKTVRRHLHTLVNQGLIQIAGYGNSFSYSPQPHRESSRTDAAKNREMCFMISAPFSWLRFNSVPDCLPMSFG